MTKGKHEEHNPKRRPTRPAAGLGQQGIDLIRSMQTQRSNEPLEDYGLDLLMGGPSEEFSEGDTRSDELSAQHQKEDMSLISDREDHSALLPSQHQTGKFYGY